MKALMLSGEQLWRKEQPIRVKYWGTLNKLADKRLWLVCRVPITLTDLIIKDRKKTNKKKPYVPQGPAKVDNDDDDTLSKSQCHLHIHIFLSQQLIPCTL